MALDPRRRQLWHALGLGPVWSLRSDDARVSDGALRDAVVAGVEPVPAQPVSAIANAPASVLGDDRARRIGSMSWDDLEQAVAACTACGLHRSRRQTVFGVGHPQAHWMLVGEAPGAEEDARGEPFVGQAGKLLDNMLASIGLSRTAGEPAASVYIANVLKCRPPGNRNPEPAEVAQCDPFLKRQVALLQPRLIVVMGRFAAQSLLQTDATIASLRGRVHEIEVASRRLPVVVTYHPAYLLRNLADKAKSWADLCLARQVYARAAASG